MDESIQVIVEGISQIIEKENLEAIDISGM